jgi:hypothetical protein
MRGQSESKALGRKEWPFAGRAFFPAGRLAFFTAGKGEKIMKAAATKQVEHYLLTLYVAGNMHMHCYLMCSDKRGVERLANVMLDKAEELGMHPLPMGLATTLSSGVNVVREIVCALGEEAKRGLETATDFHYSMWMMPDDDPADIRLMELH